ncbi:MAG: aldo/keto reductase [Planctomycetaceae bacterium]|nr:aldo/keto reductase [Planctomycetaceae bacterium]
MKYRTLGRTGLEVSVISFGTGGPSRIGQRTHGDESTSHKVLRRALDLGINLIDTAADYSDSEGIIGRALKEVPRDRYVLTTKFNPDPGEDDNVISPQQMRESCERSLQRLNTDCIDVYQFHGVVPSNYQRAVETLYPTAEKLRDEGKIRFLGVTEYFFRDVEHQMLKQALYDDIWDTIMVKYGILNQLAEQEVLPLALEKNVGVMNMSAVRVKLSRPGELEKVIARYKELGLIDADVVPVSNPLDFLIQDGVQSVVAAGYKFGIDHDAISTLLIGTGNIAHLEENVKTVLSGRLPTSVSQRLREVFGRVNESEGDSG